MRGTSSIAKAVIPQSRRSVTRSREEVTGRKDTVAVPDGSRRTTVASSGFTETTTSAPSQGSVTTSAPAATKSSSACRAPRPAPASTATSYPTAVSLPTSSGTSATRVSPALVSTATAILTLRNLGHPAGPGHHLRAASHDRVGGARTCRQGRRCPTSPVRPRPEIPPEVSGRDARPGTCPGVPRVEVLDQLVRWWRGGGRVLRSGAAPDGGALLVPDVEGHRGEQHQTLHGLLPVDGHTHQRHAVVQDPHHETTDDGADHGAHPTGDRGSTDEGRGDRVQLEVHARLGVRGGQSSGEDHAGECCQ